MAIVPAVDACTQMPVMMPGAARTLPLVALVTAICSSAISGITSPRAIGSLRFILRQVRQAHRGGRGPHAGLVRVPASDEADQRWPAAGFGRPAVGLELLRPA